MNIALIILGTVAVIVVGALGGGILWGIKSASGWGKSGKKQLPQNKKQPYAYLDEEKTSQAAVEKVARRYVDDGALGTRAQAILTTFEQADLRRKGIFSIMEQEFEKNSLTWDKFSAPVDVALDGIRNNATQIVNRMQAFDSSEYQRMDRIAQAGGYADDSNELDRLAVMRDTLTEMDEIQQQNDRLLTELERLQSELQKLTGTGAGTAEIIEEIQRLSEDAKYYS